MEGRDFYGYTIYENGDVQNAKSGRFITKRIHNGRVEFQIETPEGRKNFILSRVLYWLFVENFDMSNKNLCVSYKDNDKMNTSIDNLYLADRKDLIQGEGHRAILKITDEQIEEIKKAYKGNKKYSNQHNKTGLSLKDLGDKYGVTKGEIQCIVKSWSRNSDKYKLK